MTDWPALTTALRETMRAHAPGWTDSNDADPGITLLEMLAFVAEGFLIYRGAPALRAKAAASRLVGALQLEADVMLYEHWCGTKRPRYFSGRVLTADDLTEEQTYHRDRHRRHLRSLHGTGIVSGLGVAVGSGGDTLTIEPGLAIDPLGRELCIAKMVTASVPAATESPSLVALEYAERLVDPVPAVTDDWAEASRIEEGCRVILAPPGSGAVALARIVREAGGWTIDPSFVPARAR
jgi:hypothetical protein